MISIDFRDIQMGSRGVLGYPKVFEEGLWRISEDIDITSNAGKFDD